MRENSGAAPATVSSELLPIFTSLTRVMRIGKTGSDDDLRARRPAATPKNVHGRGVPAVACSPCRRLPPAHSMQRPSGPAPTTHGVCRCRPSQLVSLEASAAPFLQLRPESSSRAGGALPMQVIRRNGSVSPFDASKISVAMTKAFLAVEGRRRRGVAPRARDRRGADGRSRRRADAPDQRRPHLPHRGRPGSGRAGADARRAPQGRARLCALSRGTGPAARRAGSRQIGQAIVRADAQVTLATARGPAR